MFLVTVSVAFAMCFVSRSDDNLLTLMKLYELKILLSVNSFSLRYVLYTFYSFNKCIQNAWNAISLFATRDFHSDNVRIPKWEHFFFLEILRKINSQAGRNFTLKYLAKKILWNLTHLLIQFEKHMVDSECQLHSVPSMTKFHSPEKSKEKAQKTSRKKQQNCKCNLLIGNLRCTNIYEMSEKGQQMKN